MIGNLTKGTGVRGLISYLLGDRDHNGDLRSEAVVVGGTAVGTDVNSISRQYAAWRRLNPDAVYPVVHESLSPTEEDRPLTHSDMAEIGRRWAEGMGYEIYTVVSHGDHLHIAALRIKSDGNLVSTWGDFGKSENIVRKIEKEFGLNKIQSSHLLEPERAQTHRRATTKGQAKYIEIIGELPPAQRVATAIDAILADKPTRDEFEQRLAECGINARANVASTGKLNGYAYDVGGIVVTSKAIGRGYTLANLQKRGLDLFGVKKHEQNQQSAPTGVGSRRGNPGNPEANQRVASSDRVEPRKNIAGNQRDKGSDAFPGRSPPDRVRPAGRGRLGATGPAARSPQPSENIDELVSKENQVMETVSITPTAPGPHLQHLASGPAIHRRAGGNGWWPQSADDLAAAGVPLADIEWWRYQPATGSNGIAEPRLRIGLTDGAEVELRSDGVSADRATPAAEAALVALAAQRGWTSVTLTGSDTVKRRLAREMLGRGVAVTNPELADYCARVRAELVTGDTLTAPISVQPVAPARPKLGLAGWREKKQPAPAEPVQSAAEAPVQAEQPASVVPTTDELEAAAQKAGQGDVDGVLSYRTRIDVYKLAELATGDERMRAYYRSMLDADEKGYPWRGPAREALRALEREIQAGNLDDAHEKLYDAWLAMDSDELGLVRRYNERVDELREEREHDVRPS